MKKRRKKMDQIMNKMGGYWINNKAEKEISSVGDDFDVRIRSQSSSSSNILLLLLLSSLKLI